MTTRSEFDINESSSADWTATLSDEAGDPIPSAAIDSITLTLIDEQTGEIINSRDAQDALANNCTLHATSGLLTWHVQPEDTEIDPTSAPVGQHAQHLATFTITWDTDKQLHHEVLLRVLNLRRVPQA